MKNKFVIIIFFLLTLIFLFVSYSNNSNTNNLPKAFKNPNNNYPTGLPSVTTTPLETKYFSSFTGEEVSEEVVKNVPFMAIIENSSMARPQSGISEADIIFETMAEGGIPRFLGIFQKNSPKIIGPIRSVRPYFLDLTLEYSLPFAHCGGSEEALHEIKSDNLMSMDEMHNGSSYFRDASRNSPHNLYTSSEKIRALIKEKKYSIQSSLSLYFDKEFWNSRSLPSANKIEMNLNNSYKTDYILQDGDYMKYINHVEVSDRANNAPISIRNVVIQVTNIKLSSDGYRLTMDLIGEGEGYVISNGKYIKMLWSKDTINSPTILKDENGNLIPLNPGKTWWNIIDKSNTISIQ